MNQAIGGRELIEQAARAAAGMIGNGARALFGERAGQTALFQFTWADLAVIAVFLAVALVLHALLAGVLKRRLIVDTPPGPETERRAAILHTIGKPLYLLIWVAIGYFAAIPLLDKFARTDGTDPVRLAVESAFDLGVFFVLVWTAWRSTRLLELVLGNFARRSTGKFDDLLVPVIGKTLRLVLPVLGVILALPLFGLSTESSYVVQKISSLLIVGCVAWVLFQAVAVFEKFITSKYDITAANNLEARKIFTQITVLSRTLYVLISIFAVASMLMMFEEVRRFGTSILASAGVVGIIIGFAAQRTIANLFAGFQLAMTQPIRIDDVVIVEGEWGRVEEITLTYVVIKIWDQRRLIVPLSHFIEKPFQNWTRSSAEILGSIFIFTDYTVPIDEIRKEAGRLVTAHPDWDKKFWNLQVTEATDRAVQLRVLATASDSGKAWNLRCAVREGLVQFLQKNYPESLPKVRAEVLPTNAKVLSSSGLDLRQGAS
jgi:small-conductance mechanosensitive channel